MALELPALAFVITFEIDINKLKLEVKVQPNGEKCSVVDKDGFKGLIEAHTDSVLEHIKGYSNDSTDYKSLAELYIQNRGVASGARFNF